MTRSPDPSSSRRGIALVVLAVTFAGGLAAAQERDPSGRWSMRGTQGAVSLTCAGQGGGLDLDLVRGAPDGASVRGRGELSASGWLTGRFESSPGIASGVADPALLARALAGPRSGFGLWELTEGAGGPRLAGFFTGSDGARRFELGARPGAPEPREAGGFVRHLREAIALNSDRRPGYAIRTADASTALSRRLVLLERLTIPWAWWIDLRAKRWNRRGVMIVAGDFVSMQNVRPADAPPARGGVMTDEQAAFVERRLDAYRREVHDALAADRFDQAARASRVLLADLEGYETDWGCHLAMTRHIVEQIGFAALNALTWRADSGGKTDGLARGFLRGLRLGLTSSLEIDRRAQACHARGAGIIVNDVPEVPLSASFDAWVERQAERPVEPR